MNSTTRLLGVSRACYKLEFDIDEAEIGSVTRERCRKTKIPREVLDRLPEKVKAGLKGE